MPLEQNAQAVGQYLPSGLVRPGLSTISVKLRFEIRELAEEGGFVPEGHGEQFRWHQHILRVLPTEVGKRSERCSVCTATATASSAVTRERPLTAAASVRLREDKGSTRPPGSTSPRRIRSSWGSTRSGRRPNTALARCRANDEEAHKRDQQVAKEMGATAAANRTGTRKLISCPPLRVATLMPTTRPCGRATAHAGIESPGEVDAFAVAVLHKTVIGAFDDGEAEVEGIAHRIEGSPLSKSPANARSSKVKNGASCLSRRMIARSFGRLRPNTVTSPWLPSAAVYSSR